MRMRTARGRAVATLALCALALCVAKSAAEPADPCTTPGYLLFGDSPLDRVAAAVNQSKELRIVVLGGGSSTLPGQGNAVFAFPARLEAALSRRLPGVKVTVATEIKPRTLAEDKAESIDKLLADGKPNLVIWQTGTFDAMRGTDPEEFRAVVSDGVERLQNAGVDVVLMNMQYSPRTDALVPVGAYADAIRWVAREREVPIYDRLAIMRHWYDAGQFDLYAATKDMKTAKAVHNCIARTLASSIIDAAHLQAEGDSPQ